jgi:hypothetical protein
MTKEQLTVDEFLTIPTVGSLLGTVQAVEGDPESVTVTPVDYPLPCDCTRSFRLPKSEIKSVRLTGLTVSCCGKIQEVLDITFGADTQVPVVHAFRSAKSARARPTRRARSLQRMGPGGWNDNSPPLCILTVTDNSTGEVVATLDGYWTVVQASAAKETAESIYGGDYSVDIVVVPQNGDD